MFFKSLFGRPLPDDEREALQQKTPARPTRQPIVSKIPPAAATMLASTDSFTDFANGADKFFDEMKRGLMDKGGAFSSVALPVSRAMSGQSSITQTPHGAEITVTMKGVDPRGLSIELTDGVVTLLARQEYDEDDAATHRHQHIVSGVTRRFKLPFETDGAGAEATLESDTIKVIVPRSGSNQRVTRSIALKTS